MKNALRRAVMSTRSWVRTNITGGPENNYNRETPLAPSTVDERLRATMEQADFLPARTFTESGDVSKEAVSFWVGRLVEGAADLVVSGVTAGIAWMLVHWAHREKMPESGNREEVAKHLLPAAVWGVCFVILTVRRFRAQPRRTK